MSTSLNCDVYDGIDLQLVIFYMKGNKVHSAPVLVRMFMEGSELEELSEKLSERNVGWWYKTCHGIFSHERVFLSRTALLESL